VTFRKYLVLAGITVFSTAGDSLLARGMKDLGGVSLHNYSDLLLPVLNPFVAGGILLLLAFFSCYVAALSWALIAHFSFHEDISSTRWMGIALIVAGVGFVAAGPSVTPDRAHRKARDLSRDAASQEVKS
jgi:drug/metabolite transporter (DMT)-like permease